MTTPEDIIAAMDALGNYYKKYSIIAYREGEVGVWLRLKIYCRALEFKKRRYEAGERGWFLLHDIKNIPYTAPRRIDFPNQYVDLFLSVKN